MNELYNGIFYSLSKEAKLKDEVKLLPHQQDAVDFINQNSGRGLLAHSTGVGKTLESIAAIEKLREQGKADKTLVVVPASLKDNFIDQGIKKFTDNTVSNIDGKSDYQLISYDLFRKDPLKYIDESGANSLIVDEIHRAKDPRSKTNKSLVRASRKVDNFIGLTGSFISNHPKELVPLMDIVDPDHELGSERNFSRVHTKKTPIPGGFLKGPRFQIDLTREKRLAEKIGPLHYVSHDALKMSLPELKIEDIHVPMSDEQDKLYNFALLRLSRKERELIRRGLPASQEQAQHILASIAKARQASNSIGTHRDMPMAQAAEETPKLKQIMDDVESHLKNTPDGQAVVYTNLVVGGADALYGGFKERGLDPGLFTGAGTLDTSKDKRQQDVNDFLAGDKKVMILTPAGGEGLSLNNATAFFEVDRYYNPERNNQAIARVRRFGSLSHRDPEDRTIEVKRYYSDPKPSWFEIMLGQKEVGVDEWIKRVADEKDRLNEQMRYVVKSKKGS